MEPIIEIRHLKKHFGSLQVLHDIDFDIEKGEVVTIIGSSGSGKSTMLRCINMLETPSGGEILFHGNNIAAKGMNVNQYRSRVGMVFQNFNLFNNMTVLRNCQVGQEKVLGRSQEDDAPSMGDADTSGYVVAPEKLLNGHGLSHFRHTDDDQVHVAVGFVGDDAVIVQRFVFLVAEAVEDQHFSGPVLIEVEGVEVYYGLVSWRYVGELEDIECSAVFH